MVSKGTFDTYIIIFVTLLLRITLYTVYITLQYIERGNNYEG